MPHRVFAAQQGLALLSATADTAGRLIPRLTPVCSVSAIILIPCRATEKGLLE